jgi:hypothetical protein
MKRWEGIALHSDCSRNDFISQISDFLFYAFLKVAKDQSVTKEPFKRIN